MRRCTILILLLALGACGSSELPEQASITYSTPYRDIPELPPPTTTTTAPPTTTTHMHKPRVTVPRPARAQTAPRPAAKQETAPAPVSGDVWARLAACESGDLAKGTYNPRAHSASGRYHGAFQFSLATWHSVGGPGDPHEHSYEVQKSYAQKLQARSGWGQWPHCSRTLGLR